MKRIISILLATMLTALSVQFAEPSGLTVYGAEPDLTEGTLSNAMAESEESPVVLPDENQEHEEEPEAIIITEEMIAEQMELERRQALSRGDTVSISNTSEVTYPVTGTAGDNLSWELTEEGVFTITGTGEIPDYSYSGAPWYSCIGLIKNIVIGEGITSIGRYTFYSTNAISSITFPKSIEAIDEYAMWESDYFNATVSAYDGTIGELFGKAIGKEFVCLDTDNINVFASGTLGSNITWTLYDTAHLSVEGSGAMSSDYDYSSIPWYAYAEYISTIEISSGITNIIYGTVAYSDYLTAITVPASVTDIDDALNRADTIIGWNNTLAELYANAYGIAFECRDTNTDEVYTEGTYGSSITWTLYDTARLVIAGSGNLGSTSPYEYGYMPWYSNYADYIRTAELPEGITAIGKNCFYSHDNLVEVNIPSTVTQICEDAFSICPKIETLHIPAAVNTIDIAAFSTMSTLAAVTVDEANTAYVAVDGVLYNAAMTELITYPVMREAATFEIPDTVTTVCSEAWSFNRYFTSLNTLVIPASVTALEDIPHTYFMVEFVVDEANTVYASEDGVLFSKDMTQLIAYPLESAATEYTVPDSVTTLCDNSFCDPNVHGSETLRKLTIPKTVTSIADGAMSRYCYYTVYFNNGSIAELYAKAYNINCVCIEDEDTRAVVFSGTCGLYNSDNVTWALYDDCTLEISGNGEMDDYYASWSSGDMPWYEYRTYVKTLTVGEGVTGIGEYAFYEHSKLTEITLPNSLTEISRNAFYNCSYITDVTLPEGLLTIEQGAFQSIWQLKSVAFPSTLVSIGDYAFSGGRLTEITLPDSLTTIGEEAFGSNDLTSVTIPRNVASMGYGVFQYNSDLTEILVADGNQSYSSVDGVLFNIDASTLMEYPCGKTDTTYAIPDTVTAIQDYAFYQSDTLVETTIPAAVASVGSYNFYYCDNLQKVTVESRDAAFGTYCFKYSGSLTVYVYDGTTAEVYVKNNNIPYEMLDEDIANIIAEGVCGDSLTWTLDEYGKLVVSGEGVMYDWTAESEMPWYTNRSSVKTVELADTVTSVGAYAFYNCDSLISITMNGVTVIGAYGFYNCDNLISVTIPSTCQTIGASAFQYCYRLATLVLSEGVTEIGSDAFNYCYNLTSVSFPPTLRSIGNAAFRSCWGLGTLTLPEGLTTLGEYAFYDCDLSSVTLPVSLTAMGQCALAYNHFTEITIPMNVTEIGNRVFYYCENLQYIYVDDANTAFSDIDGILYNKDQTALIYVSVANPTTEFTVPATVTTIRYNAFLDNKVLQKIVMQEGVTTIENEAIQYCNALTSITVPSTVVSVGIYNFHRCSLLEEAIVYSTDIVYDSNCFTDVGDVVISGYDGSSTEFLAKERGIEFIYLNEDGDQPNTIVSGTCGDALTWTLDDAGTLTISGTGAMTEFEYYGAPWEPYKSQFQSVVIEEGVTTMGQFAFLSAQITSISLPDTLTRIGYTCIAWCHNLESIIIPKNVSEISWYGIFDCDGLKTVELKTDVLTFDTHQVGACDGIEQLIIPEDSTQWTMVDGVLYNKEKTKILFYPPAKTDTEFTIEDGVTVISAAVFDTRNHLNDITVPASVVTIENNNFYNCTALENVTILGMETTFGSDCFTGGTSADVTISAHDGSDAEIYAKNNGITFICLDEEDLPNIIASGTCGDNLTWTFRDDGLLTISGTGAMSSYSYNGAPWYSYRSRITTVVIEEGVTSLGQYAFYSCSALTSISLPSTLTTIDSNAINYCNAFAEYIVAEGNTAYSSEDGVLFNADKTTLIRYPLGKTDISYTVPGTVKTIGYEAFYECNNLKTVTLPDSLETIGGYAFYFCGSLLSVNIPDSVVKIDYNAFYYCGSLLTVSIPSSVETIGDSAFRSCSSLTAITVDTANPNYASKDGVLFDKSYSTLLLYPEGKTSATYSIPVTVTTINSYAFYSIDHLTEVVIPQSVTEIQYNNFCSCYSLVKATVYSTDAAINFYSLRENNSSFEIHGYVGSTAETHASTYSITFVALETCAHVFEETATVDLEPTCTEPGQQSVHCTLCTYVKDITEIAALGHDFEDDYTIDKVAACEEDGSKSQHCSRCTTVQNETVIEKLGHNYGDWVTISELTCETDGVKRQTCSNCYGYLEERENALGHLFAEEITVDIPATCITDGSQSRHCTREGCDGKTDVTVIPMLGHNMGEWYTTTPATCTTDGEAQSDCGRENCGYFETKVLEALGHDHSEEFTVDVEPTCTTTGEKSRHCQREGCNDRTEVTVLEELGHDFSDWKTTVEPTCTEVGEERRDCERDNCDHFETNVLDALGHDYAADFTVDVEPTCTAAGEKSRHCQREGCNDRTDVTVLEELGHDFSDWRTTVEPTCTEVGEERRDCERDNCDHFETNVLDALGHDYSEDFTVDVEPTCTTAGEKSRHCQRDGCNARTEVTVLEELGHDFSDWRTTVEPTCTEVGEERRDCERDNCDHFETNVLAALGHNFSEEWTFDPEVTCTEDGYKFHECSRCDEQAGGTVVEAAGHQLTEWIVDKSPSLLAEGSKYRICNTCDYEENEVIEKITVDLDDPDHGAAYFTVVNAATLEPIEGASIYIADTEGEEYTLITDENGMAAAVLPVGKQRISVYASGYITRNITLTIVSGEQEIPKIGISDRDLIEATLTSTEMTYEEILAAGIDVNDPANQQVYKYAIEIRFKPEFDWVSVFAYFNLNGYIGMAPGGGGIPNRDNCSWSVEDDDGDGDGDPEDYDGKIIPGGRIKFRDDSTGESMTVYPVDEYFYLIIYGEARWLKEMYDVEMLIMNNSMTDTLTNAVATLELPEGLSLAAMVGGAQSKSQVVGDIAGGESASVHWYVRGDDEGTYEVSAALKGVMQPFEEDIYRRYTASDSIKVYAGSALHMNIILPKYTYYGDDYTVRVELTNVSDKTLYNISNAITGIKEGRVTYYSDGTVEEEVYLEEGYQDSSFMHEFKPGDKLVVETTVEILFESKLMEYHKDQIVNEITKVETMMGQYNSFTKAVNSMNSFMKTSGTAVDSFIKSAGNIPVSKAALVKKLASAVLSFCDDFNIGNKKVIDVLEAMNNLGYMNKLEKFGADPESILEESPKTLRSIINVLKTAEEEEPFNIYDSLRTFVEALPVHFYVENVMVTTLEGSTTEIPWSVQLENNYKVQYFGIDNMGKYMYSLAIGMVGEIDVPWRLNLLGAKDDPTGYGEAVEYIKMQDKQMEALMVTDTTDEKEIKVWTEEGAGTSSVYTADAPFTITCDSDNAVYENGVLTFTGSGVIEITANGTAGGRICISSDGELVKTYVVEGVEAHTCESDTWVFDIRPTEDHTGLMAKYCDECGELTDTKVVALCDEHTYGDTVIESDEDGTVISYLECGECGYREYSADESETPATITGDVNNSGLADDEDSRILSQYFAGYDVSGELLNTDAADVNGDGSLTRADAMILTRYLAGWADLEVYFD